MAVIVLEELAMTGVKRFMSIGTAGTLQKRIKAGDLVVCDRAICDEGTSHHYREHSKYAHASEEMTAGIIASLKKRRRKYVVGTSWTIDAPFRETGRHGSTSRKASLPWRWRPRLCSPSPSTAVWRSARS